MMEKNIDDVIIQVINEEKFDLKKYYAYVNKYGKPFMLKVFNTILSNATNVQLVYEKYFDVYFSFELENMEITDSTYLLLTNKYGEEMVNEYFSTLLEINHNSVQIKEKYEKIYFYIDTIKGNDKVEINKIYNSDDSVRDYLKEIASYELLSPNEEINLLMLLNKSKDGIEIGYIDGLDNLVLDDILGFVNSIKTKEQLKKVKKILKILNAEQAEILQRYIVSINKQLKTIEIIDNGGIYKEDYFNKQLDLIISFINTREKLVNANLRLVVSVAKRYVTSGVHLLDLIQEGNFGLIKAIRRFDCSKKTRLSTYATWWIRQYITRYISDNGGIVRIPVHFNEKIYKYKQAVRILSQKLSDVPSDEEIAEYLQFSLEDVEDIKNVIYSSNYVALDGFLSEDEDSTIIDFIPTDVNMEELLFEDALKERMVAFLSTLKDKEAEVIKYRFGFYDGKIYTLKEIGEIYGITRERVRQIENKAIRKLKMPVRKRIVEDFSR